MTLPRIRLVTFDVTNTLLHFRSPPGEQYSEIGAMYGVLCDKNRLTANFKSHWTKMNHDHPNFGQKSGLGWERWWKMIVTGTFKDSHSNLDDRKIDAIATHLIEAYQTSTCWQQSYGAFGLLSYLRNTGIPMGVISNYDPRLHNTLINTRLRHYFRFLLASYDAGVEKPDPQIFKNALEMSKIDNIKPENCLHVGDEVYFDYQGARDNGWNAALVVDKNFDEIQKEHPNVLEKHHFLTLHDLHKHLIINKDNQQRIQAF